MVAQPEQPEPDAPAGVGVGRPPDAHRSPSADSAPAGPSEAGEPVILVKVDDDILADRRLTATAKLVYIRLKDRQGKNANSWPGLRSIAADVGTDVKSVRRSIEALASKGLVLVSKGAFGGARVSNRYRIPVVEKPTDDSADSARNDHCTVGDITTDDRESTVGKMTTNSGQNDQSSVGKMTTKPSKRTTSTTSKEKKAPDSWESACAAMTTLTLQTDKFREAWSAWAKYRRELHKPLTASTVTGQIHKLEKFGHDEAVAALQRSIENGWQGIFPARERETDAARGTDRRRTRRTESLLPGDDPKAPVLRLRQDS